MNFKKNIEDICTRLDGVDLFGVAPIERFLDLPENKRPTNLLPDAKSVIVLASQVFKILTDKLSVSNKVGEISYRDIYNAHNETVINDLRQTGYRVARYLTNKGFTSINLGQDLTDYRTISSIFSFKYAAVAAGLGVIGKNGLLITPIYGPRIKLTAVITEAHIEPDAVNAEDPCQDCNICIKVCPSGALKEPEQDQRVNHNRFVCNSYYTASGGCGLCMSRCPR